MRDLAYIAKIDNLTSIKDKDRIELATIANWNVIVEKNKYSVGDLVVYVEYDTVLPIKPEFEFLRSRCYSKKYNGFRIRNMKMAEVFSQGIVFPLSVLPDKKWKEGQSVVKELGVRKYDPEEFAEKKESPKKGLKKFLYKIPFFRKFIKLTQKKQRPYPDTVKKSDEENIQKIFDDIKHIETLYTVTEKLEGQAVSYMLVGKKREFRVYSHNKERTNIKTGTGNWESLARDLDIASKLKKLKNNYCIQGEIIGPGIQRNIYHRGNLELYVYAVCDTDTGKYLGNEDLETFCITNGFTMVPIIEKFYALPPSVDEILIMSNGMSLLYETKREGVVWRNVHNPSISFKAKSPEYLMWFDKKDQTI